MRLKRKLALLLTAAMMISSANVTSIPVFAEEVANATTGSTNLTLVVKHTATAADFDYDSDDGIATAASGSDLGTVTTYYKVEGIWTSTKPTDAGTYDVAVVTSGSDTYYPIGSASDPFSIGQTYYIAKKGAVDAPSLIVNNETIKDKADGTLTGLTTEMEYKKTSDTDYTAVTDGDMTFAVGSYDVRYKEDKNHYEAGHSVTVEIKAGRMLEVNLPTDQAGYTLTVDKSENEWHACPTITFSVKKGYTKESDFAVKVNGEAVALIAQSDGSETYTLPAMESDAEVTVVGVTDLISDGINRGLTNIVLTEDVVIKNDITIPDGFIVDTNGHTLTIDEDVTLTNDGTIDGQIINNGNISGGTVIGQVTNDGSITGANIGGDVDNTNGQIQDGTIEEEANVSGGEISGSLTNNGTISDGDLSGNITNNGAISDGDLSGNITNNGTLINETISGNVDNKNGTITSCDGKTVIAENAKVTDGNICGNVENDGTIEGTGDLNFSNSSEASDDATVIVNKGNITVDGNLTISTGATVKNEKSSEEKSGRIIVSGNLIINGKMENNGKIVCKGDTTGGDNISGQTPIQTTVVVYDETTASNTNISTSSSLVYTFSDDGSSGLVTITVESQDKNGNTEGDSILKNIEVSTVNQLMEECLSESELQDVKDGKYDVDIKLSITLDPEETNQVSLDEKKIKKAIKSKKLESKNLKLGDLVDITLESKKSTEDNWNKVTDLNSKLKITVEVPSKLIKKNRKYYMMRNHDGQVTLLANKSKNSKNITFETDRFSTYAIVYTGKAKNNTKNNKADSNASNKVKPPKTGDTSNSSPFGANSNANQMADAIMPGEMKETEEDSKE